ncbi:MAG: SGNH/GDSL hydrolase family protein, partial [Bacteroidetes bacterium]|nr:SGNH/GDSL hydrolase family protein [Bacteroidota bacterium]
LAVCGYTAMDLARYISSNFSNLKQFEPGIISILIGTNDVKKNTLATDFEIAYRQVILKALLLSCNRNVVLIKLPYFPKNVAYPYNFGMNEKVDSCNEIIGKMAANYNLRIMEFQLNDADLFDGVHLNAAGSKSAGLQLSRFIEADKGLVQINEMPVITKDAITVNGLKDFAGNDLSTFNAIDG